MSKALTVAFAVVIIGLAAALFAPTLIDATQGNAVAVEQMEVGDTANLTERLTLSLDAVNTAQDNATVTLTDETTFADTQTIVDNDTTSSTTLSGDVINVSVSNIDASDVVTLSVTYPPMFAWNDGARVFYENSGIIIAALALVMVVAVAIVGIDP